jgi:hypothetical protein
VFEVFRSVIVCHTVLKIFSVGHSEGILIYKLILSLPLFVMVSLPMRADADIPFTIKTPEKSSWIGPRASIHFGNGGPQFSLGLELSHWRETVKGYPMLGLNLGAEYNFTTGHWVEYSELQLGVIMGGLSVGPVYDQAHGFGVQTSLWVNFLAGVMLRFRYFGPSVQTPNFSGGVYFAFPFHEASDE